MRESRENNLNVDAFGSFFMTSMILLNKPLLPLHMRPLHEKKGSVDAMSINQRMGLPCMVDDKLSMPRKKNSLS